MADYATLKAAIQAVIYENGNQEITGSVMQATLLAMVNSLGANYQYAGIATPSTNPGTPDQNVFYIAGPGTYLNFNAAVISDGYIGILKYNGTWTVESIAVGKDYDEQISQLNQKVDNLSAGKYYGFYATESDLPMGGQEDGFAYVGMGIIYTIYNYRNGVWTSSGINTNLVPVGNGEDIDQDAEGKLQFANRAYNAQQPNGKGYKILRKGVSFASQVTDTNTVYEIRYDFDLDSAFTMPAGCVLRFVGGSISGSGTLTFSETVIEGDAEITCGIAGTIDGVVNVGWFGLKPGTSSFDNGVVINKVAAVFKKLVIPAGDFYFSTPIVFPGCRYIEVVGNLYYKGTGTNVSAITVGGISNGVFHFYGIISGENAPNIVYNSSGKTSVIGLTFESTNNSLIEVKNIWNFNEGLRVMGTTQGTCYNQFRIGAIRDTNTHIRITQDGGGWANQNAFYGGRLYNQTSWKTANPTALFEAIRIQGPGTTSDTYKHCNNLLFMFFSTEGFTGGYSVLGDSISRCRFIQFRNEGSSGKFIKFVGTCLYNVVSMGYSSAASGTGTGGGTGIDISEANSYPLDFHDQKSFEIADLDVYVWERCYKNGAAESYWYFPKHRIVNFGYSDLRESHYSTNFTEGTLNPNGKSPTVIVDTTNCKFYRVQAEGSGRIMIRYLTKSDGTVIDGLQPQKDLGFPMGLSVGSFQASNLIYGFQSASDVKTAVIGIPDGVAKVAIAFNGVCKRIKVYSLDTPVIPEYFSPLALVGDTSGRPAHAPIGMEYYDTTLNKKIVWNGTAWVNMDGTALT